MGKGDRKSRKAKIWKGSYGNTRPRKRKKSNAVKSAASAKPKKAAAAAPKKKAPAKKAKTEE
jgi:30S ribosomal protein S31